MFVLHKEQICTVAFSITTNLVHLKDNMKAVDWQSLIMNRCLFKFLLHMHYVVYILGRKFNFEPLACSRSTLRVPSLEGP